MGITMASVQCQVSVSIAGEKHWAEINLQSDGLYSTVHTDVPLSYRNQTTTKKQMLNLFQCRFIINALLRDMRSTLFHYYRLAIHIFNKREKCLG